MDAVLLVAVAVAAAVVANPENDPVTGVAEVDTTTGTPGVVNPVLAGVAVVPSNFNTPPRNALLVVVVTGVAPRVSTELRFVAPPGVNAGVGFTIAGAVVLPASNVKPCNGVDPKLNPPTVG